MIRGYFWKNGEVVPHHESMDACPAKEPFFGCPCVDLAEDEPHRRYGRYLSSGWDYWPLDQFPALFRMHLLLLEVG